MTQQAFWNKKFEQDGYLYGMEPNAFIKACYQNFKKSQRVLCLGEGEGRNALFLAKRGYSVAALDTSDVGLNKLQQLAGQENVQIKTRCIDLNDWVPSKKYGAIVFSFLHLLPQEKSTLLAKIDEALKAKGFFIAEVFAKSQVNYSSGGPKESELLYDVDDFKTALPHCIIHKLEEVEVMLDEGKGHQGLAKVIRIIAQKT